MKKISTIRLMIEYGAYPVRLYDDECCFVGMTLPPECRKNSELKEMFDGLQDRYDALFIEDGHECDYIGFATQEEEQAFYRDLDWAKNELKRLCADKYVIEDDFPVSCEGIKAFFKRAEDTSRIVEEENSLLCVVYGADEETCDDTSLQYSESNTMTFSCDATHRVRKFRVEKCNNYSFLYTDLIFPPCVENVVARLYFPENIKCKVFALMVYNDGVEIIISDDPVPLYYFRHGNLIYGVTEDNCLQEIFVLGMTEENVTHMFDGLLGDMVGWIEQGLCPNCRADISYYMESSSCGYQCTSCEWGIVTTSISPIYCDRTDYTVSIAKIEEPSANQIRVIAKLLGVNYLKARNLLLEGEAQITECAVEVQKHRAILREAGIAHGISPLFPYEETDE